jgi:hypothetical protein
MEAGVRTEAGSQKTEVRIQNAAINGAAPERGILTSVSCLLTPIFCLLSSAFLSRIF